MAFIYYIAGIFIISLAWIYGFKREIVILLSLLVAPGLWSIAHAETKAAWELLHEKLHIDQETFTQALDTAFPLLKLRAEKEDKEQAARLLPPPRLKTGYQLLPSINPQEAGGNPPPLAEQHYDMRSLEPTYRDDCARAQTFLKRIQSGSGALKDTVDEYIYLRERLGLFAAHLAYHAQWQRAALQSAKFFAEKNAIIKKLRELRVTPLPLKTFLADPQIKHQLAPFIANPHLHLIHKEKSALLLPVHFATDISDKAFLELVKSTLEIGFNSSLAAKKRSFSVAISFTQINPRDLYHPRPSPPVGAALDITGHLALFPKDTLVLTAAGESTHAFAGRSLILAAGSLSARILLHEFCHVLGFSDAYIRGFDGLSRDPGGVVFVEFTGLYADIMGFPGGGEISDEMIAQLIKEYDRGR
jgi:hypothetical protein